MPSILKNGVVIATCDFPPDEDDLATRGEVAIEETGEIGQVWDGTVFTTPAVAPVAVSVITKLQLKKELVSRGLWTTLLAALDSDPDAKEDFMLASEIDIADPTVVQFATALGYTQTDLDDLFRAAAGK